MKRNPRLLIDGRVCSVSLRHKEQASGKRFSCWYAYWFDEDGKKHNKYLGKQDPRGRYQLVQEGTTE